MRATTFDKAMISDVDTDLDCLAYAAGAGTVMDANERERKWLSRELHDDIAQRIALLSAELAILRQRLTNAAEDIQDSVAGIAAETASLGADVHRIVQGLHPSELQRLGLEASIRRHCSRLANVQGLSIELDIHDVPPALDLEAALCLYRIYILAMLFLVRGWRRILATMSAFTATHSVTLSAAALGWVLVPQPPVEACIALSIVFVAREIVRAHQGVPGLTARWPWVVAFTFGLMHGFGFAGALAEVGLPDRAIPVALLFFNVGVELGQLVFVAGVLAAIVLLKRIPRRWPLWAETVPPYAIGAVAMFWVIERLAAFAAH